MKKLYIKGGETAKNILELIQGGFATAYGGKFTTTFHDPEHEKQEDWQRRRSFEDLLVVCRTYLPETTEEELAKVLVHLYITWRLRGMWCPDIQKVVFIADNVPTFYKLYGYGQEDVGFTKGKGQYDIHQICKLAGTDYPPVKETKEEAA